jgi:hypothetical protein
MRSFVGAAGGDRLAGPGRRSGARAVLARDVALEEGIRGRDRARAPVNDGVGIAARELLAGARAPVRVALDEGPRGAGVAFVDAPSEGVAGEVGR